jgi:FimV-like protein
MRVTVFGKSGATLAILFFLSSAVQADVVGSRTFESRYLSIQLGPEHTQTDLLQSIVEIDVPEKITTVGESLNFLLRPYGFTLDENPETDEHYLLLILALPEPHRHLASMTLKDALITLGGKSFRPLINPVKRSVRYQLREGFGQFASADDRKMDKQRWREQRARSFLVQQAHQGYGPVQRGDSLSRIASQLNLTDMTIDQTLVYLFRANPYAFANDNMNHLLAGAILQLPRVETKAVLTAFEASQFVDEHYRQWLLREVTP